MILHRPHEYSKKEETSFFKKDREKLKAAYVALEEPVNGKLMAYVPLRGLEFMEEENFFEPERNDVKRFWKDHSIPKKYADGKSCGDILISDGIKASTYRLTHHFSTSNGFGGIAIFNTTSTYDHNEWYIGYIVNQKENENLKSLPAGYNKDISSALSYLTVAYKCHFSKKHTYVRANGHTVEYYRCNFDKPIAPAQGKKRISKKEKENSACKFTFMLINDGREIKINLRHGEHDHDFSSYQPSYILPSLKEYIISNYNRPLCFIKKEDVINLKNNFEITYPELKEWKYTTYQEILTYCYNQSITMFNDNEISTGSNIKKVLNTYNITAGRWSTLSDTAFKTAVTIMPEHSQISWVGTFLAYDIIPQLAAASNSQLYFDG